VRLGLRSSLFPTNKLYALIYSLIRATCQANLNLDLIILIILEEEYKSRSSSLRSFSHSPVTSSLFVQIFSSVPHSQTPSIYVHLLMSETKFCIHTELQAELGSMHYQNSVSS
jgi:hypothetical protein